MTTLLRILHLASLGLWLGAVTFFSFFTALPIIHHMQQLAAEPNNWVHLTEKREGTRLAGEALTPVFEWYFPYQVACGAVAVLTSLAWVTAPGKVHKLRVIILALALGLAAANLAYLAPRVHQLRVERYSSDTAVAQAADEAFGKWHNYSLGADMVTLLCVLVGMCLAAALPERASRTDSP